MKNVTKITDEIFKESIDIAKGRFIGYLSDAEKTIEQIRKKQNPERSEIITLFNTAEMYLDKARQNFHWTSRT